MGWVYPPPPPRAECAGLRLPGAPSRCFKLMALPAIAVTAACSPAWTSRLAPGTGSRWKAPTGPARPACCASWRGLPPQPRGTSTWQGRPVRRGARRLPRPPALPGPRPRHQGRPVRPREPPDVRRRGRPPAGRAARPQAALAVGLKGREDLPSRVLPRARSAGSRWPACCAARPACGFSTSPLWPSMWPRWPSYARSSTNTCAAAACCCSPATRRCGWPAPGNSLRLGR